MDQEKKEALKALVNSPEVESMFSVVMNGRQPETMRPVHPNRGVSEGVTA